MMETYYGLDALGSGGALFASLAIGFFFGLALERAGFGSSRRISGIFYFRDMAVLKVMFTALLVAMLGLAFVSASGIMDLSGQIYYMKTYYGTYVVAGLIFGIGFVMSGWCPGTAAVGLASGKLDALVFLVGAIIGCVLFNELFPVLKPLYTWGESTEKGLGVPGMAFVYKTLGMSRNIFLILFTILAILCFWGAEYVEKIRSPGQVGVYFNSPFLKAFCLALLVFAVSLQLLSGGTGKETTVSSSTSQEASGAVSVLGSDLPEITPSRGRRLEPEELASRLLSGKADLVVVDVRPEEEYMLFHIRGAVNVQPPDLPAFMLENKRRGDVVLYSNGMTDPALAREELFRLGRKNVYILTDGVTGFLERCLKPVSLRPEPVDAKTAGLINSWRRYFLEERID